MSVTYLQHVPIGTKEFTKEVLDTNFQNIADYTIDVARYVSHLEGHVGELSKQVATLSKQVSKGGGKLVPFAVGAAVGIYIYKNRRKMEALVASTEDARRRFTQDASYTQKSNGENPTND